MEKIEERAISIPFINKDSSEIIAEKGKKSAQ
jgi:hypothetical protein